MVGSGHPHPLPLGPRRRRDGDEGVRRVLPAGGVAATARKIQPRGVWPSVEREFEGQSSKLMVVRKMLEYGISVSDKGRLYVGGLEVDYSALAEDAGTDRRVAKQTAMKIVRNPFLFSIFSRLKPVGASLLPVVSSIGCSAIIIEADPRAAGVISGVTGVLAKHGVVVRQALADDPDMVSDASLTLVVEGTVEGRVIGELEALDMVRGVTVRK